MTATAPTILTTCMGLNRARDPWEPGPVFGYAAELAQAATSKLCVLTNAGRDEDEQSDTRARFEAAFAGTAFELSVLTSTGLADVEDLAGYLGGQDIIWADRGNLVKLITEWRAHGLDTILRDCWQDGVVLGGESAGSLCWASAGTTDSSGTVEALADGLGFLPCANAVHYADRRELFHEMIRDGDLEIGYGIDTGAGLHFEGERLVRAISDRPRAGAYRVQRDTDGTVTETALEVQRLRRT